MPTSLLGKNLIAGGFCGSSAPTFNAVSPLNSTALEPAFEAADALCIATAAQLAEDAAPAFAKTPPAARADFLDQIAQEILALGDSLLQRAHLESGLPLDRLTGERTRTVGQLQLFAQHLREGSWCEAIIDTALPDRKPLPRPDLRRCRTALGPVAVFGASNFPLAFSVAGGDTASALAAGCPVLVKAHPAHPGTSELVATALAEAIRKSRLPEGLFSLLHGNTPQTSLQLVSDPRIQAVGFTGSHKAGRALLDAAAQRPVPIPVFAEMSSLNPVFLFPHALQKRGPDIAEGLKNSVTLGVGQFCTKPGLVILPEGEPAEAFIQHFRSLLHAAQPGTLLTAAIRDQFATHAVQLSNVPCVSVLAYAGTPPRPTATQGAPVALITTADIFLRERSLQTEVFGPFTLVLKARSTEQFAEIAACLEGQLTATLHLDDEDLPLSETLLKKLHPKAGRLLFNGFPTGVEVSHAMHHGGPYPAASDARFTSVGTAAIQRWTRPICLQNFPASLLPDELRDENPLRLLRLVNGTFTRDPITP